VFGARPGHALERVDVSGVELTDREETILRSIIEGHIRTARPVSSNAVVRLSSVRLSSATVRNVMRALEEKGLIRQPHTSAGRVPTDRGYRYYVDNLVQPSVLTPRERSMISSELARLVHCDLATVLAGVSHMISELSKEMAVAMAPSGGGQLIERVALVAVEGGRVLVVVSTDVGPTRTAVLTTGRALSDAELEEATGLLNEWLTGVALSESFVALESGLEAMEKDPGESLSAIFDGVRAFLHPGGGQRIHYEGARHIFRHPEFSENASSLGGILDSEEALADVLTGPAEAARVRVVIGGENTRSGMSRLSLVTASYRLGGSMGRMGIIGPTRMKYPRMIGLVTHVSQVLDELMSERRGGGPCDQNPETGESGSTK
jgi:heat-inducible transcriptional repressor